MASLNSGTGLFIAAKTVRYRSCDLRVIDTYITGNVELRWDAKSVSIW